MNGEQDYKTKKAPDEWILPEILSYVYSLPEHAHQQARLDAAEANANKSKKAFDDAGAVPYPPPPPPDISQFGYLARVSHTTIV